MRQGKIRDLVLAREIERRRRGRERDENMGGGGEARPLQRIRLNTVEEGGYRA